MDFTETAVCVLYLAVTEWMKISSASSCWQQIESLIIFHNIYNFSTSSASQPASSFSWKWWNIYISNRIRVCAVVSGFGVRCSLFTQDWLMAPSTHLHPCNRWLILKYCSIKPHQSNAHSNLFSIYPRNCDTLRVWVRFFFIPLNFRWVKWTGKKRGNFITNNRSAHKYWIIDSIIALISNIYGLLIDVGEGGVEKKRPRIQIGSLQVGQKIRFFSLSFKMCQSQFGQHFQCANLPENRLCNATPHKKVYQTVGQHSIQINCVKLPIQSQHTDIYHFGIHSEQKKIHCYFFNQLYTSVYNK